MSLGKQLNIKALKTFAIEKLPKSSTLRDILLSEPDQIPQTEFLIKLDIWTRLFNLEEQH